MARWRSVAVGVALAGVGLTVGAGVLDALFPPALERYFDRSALVVDEVGRPLRGFTSRDDKWRLATTPSGVDAFYLKMLLAYEDKRFRRHPGVDPLAVGRAALQALESGRAVSGASTLTMQTVRLLEPRPRTILSKIIEMARALQLEWHYDKDAILAMYLTLAPFGGNLEGIEAAAWFYFGKAPRNLTAAEAALLVALPQSPTRLRPDRHPERTRKARDKVLARMVHLGVLSPARAAEAREEATPGDRRAQPFLAPHAARRLVAEAPDEDLHRSFIDRDLQALLEDLARGHLRNLEPEASLAVLVVETQGRKVRGYVGSAGFEDFSREGQVDMVVAARSPGSTLKPFIYGLGFDLLAVHPETLVEDRPTRFGDYAPANFDQRYRGLVTVREALQESLNIPAVAVLDRVGPDRFARAIAEAGVPLRLDARLGRPALPIALGGVGVSLEGLVTLYAALADHGRVEPLRLRAGPSPPGAEAVSLLSEKAAWYLTAILRDTPPPSGRMADDDTARRRRIALKTGTSYGFRDAWALGFDGGHVVGVWIGRADGGFGSGRTGRLSAAPLLYAVFDALPDGGARFDAPPPEVLSARVNADLPPPMRRLRSEGEPSGSSPDGPEIRFPPDGAVVELVGDQSLQLRADGGRRPLRWLVDGRALDSSPVRRDLVWRPPGQGLVRITVVDGLGRADTARVWLRLAKGRN